MSKLLLPGEVSLAERQRVLERSGNSEYLINKKFMSKSADAIVAVCNEPSERKTISEEVSQRSEGLNATGSQIR